MESDDSTSLAAALNEYGYPLLRPNADPNDLLASLVESENTRMLEGFPVVLANALSREDSGVDLAKAEAQLGNLEERKKLRALVQVSLFLFELYGLEDLRNKAKKLGLKDEPEFKKQLAGSHAAKLAGGKELDLDRLKTTFLNYVVRQKEHDASSGKEKLREEFRNAFLLSLVFSPKQKDLLKKRLRHEPMNKTEREYFSRVVKKKLQALADPDLHRMAQRALQK